jgi:ABC-type bacteriocin/lantibiotic exporter with double-glycine peptidase domain
MYLIVAFKPTYFQMPISELSFLENSVDGVIRSIRDLGEKLTSGWVGDLFKIRNVFECIDFKSQVAKPKNPAKYHCPPGGMKIQVRDLTFRYNEHSPAVLTDINFTVESGEIVSIVGYNGSGFLLFDRV